MDARRGRRVDRPRMRYQAVRARRRQLRPALGFHATKGDPARRERRPKAIKQWLDEEYPAIAERGQAENSEIQWGDETALVNTDVCGRSYAPKGETPVTCAPGKREKLSAAMQRRPTLVFPTAILAQDFCAMHPLDGERSYGIDVDGAGRATISIHLLMEFF